MPPPPSKIHRTMKQTPLPLMYHFCYLTKQLEEAQGNDKMPDKIIERGMKSLQAHGVVIDREAWIKV
jgi:hypothetical protein